MVVVLEHKIYVYNFADLKLVDHIETTPNPKGPCRIRCSCPDMCAYGLFVDPVTGLCAICSYDSNTVLVCPGLQKGHVRVELYDAKKTTLIPAHETALACFALNLEGTRLATASEKVRFIHIDLAFRRGSLL